MKVVFFLLPLLAVTFSAPATETNGFDVNNEPLLIFALVAAQRHGVDPSNVLDLIMPTLLKDGMKFSKEKQLALLSAGGLAHDQAMSVLRDLLPILMHKGKSVEEQAMALLLASKQFCRKNKDEDSTCPEEEETVLPLVAMQTERGCDFRHIETEGDVVIPTNETCLCDDQTDLMFWISLLGQFSEKAKTETPDQFPLMLLLFLDDAKCSGTLKHSVGPCTCTQVNMGHEATLLQYLITSPEVRNLLTDEQRKIVTEALGTPAHRASLTMQDYLYSVMAGFTSPQMLSLLQNQGQGKDSMLKQLILSSIGIDSSMVHIILNGGFNDNADKMSIIKYLTNMGALDASIIPFLLGVQNGKDFLLASMVNSGQLDPLMTVMLGMAEGGLTTEELLNLMLFQSFQAKNPALFDSIGKPYVPALPRGVYPGSHLYFAHFETLGVNTCSLHDLRNRYDCGYIGISAAECESVPYCCYNPVFLTDVEVRNATEGQITSAATIPWCYYNIFFVYYNTYYMEVKAPGEFAAPLECFGLFKYGLKLDPNLYHLYDPQNPNTGISRLMRPRYECGFPGISEFQCVAIRGCCWDGDAPYRIPQCFKRNGALSLPFKFSKIPAAFMPKNGTCNLNKYEIPLLYDMRTPCHYRFEFYIAGYDILAVPNEMDCTTKLGCCWERNEEVLRKYPNTPRCYERVGGYHHQVPSGLPSASALIRSGGSDEAGSQVVEYAIGAGMPPVMKP